MPQAATTVSTTTTINVRVDETVKRNVIDTNVHVSSAISKHGNPKALPGRANYYDSE